MSLPPLDRELLLRFLDGTLPEAEELVVAQHLRDNPTARAFLREVAEVAIAVADCGRMAQAAGLPTGPPTETASSPAHLTQTAPAQPAPPATGSPPANLGREGRPRPLADPTSPAGNSGQVAASQSATAAAGTNFADPRQPWGFSEPIGVPPSLGLGGPAGTEFAPGRSRWSRTRRFGLVAACLLLGGMLVAAERLWSERQRVGDISVERARVERSGGLVHVFDGRGQIIAPLPAEHPLWSGDLLRTNSSDAWAELRMEPAGTLFVSGYTGLKFLKGVPGEQPFVLERGSLWFDAPPARSPRMLVTTMVAEVHSEGGTFSVQSSAEESIVRVEAGTARVTERFSDRILSLMAGEEVTLSLVEPGQGRVIRQRTPVTAWKLRLPANREVSYGTVLARDPGHLRVRAAPLLWPVPHREPLLFHVAGFAAWQCSESPVVLTPGSRLRFRGALTQPQSVRFGFSTARVQGVFAGKFEQDIPPERLTLHGTAWEIELPLAEFHPLADQAVSSPVGMELTDVYALTVTTDAGLELHNIELLPADAGQPETP